MIQLQENDRVESVEEILYHDPNTYVPVIVPIGMTGTVTKVVDRPDLTMEAAGIKFDDVDTPIVLARSPGYDTMAKVKKL